MNRNGLLQLFGCLAAMAGLLAAPAFAVDRTFILNNTSMTNPASWSPGGVPGAGDKGIIGGDETPITANFTANLSGPPDAIVVRSNGTIKLPATAVSMTTEHNVILEGGTLTSLAVNNFGGTISLRNESRFLTSGAGLGFTGLIQNAGAEAGRLIVTNASTNLAGYVTMYGAGNNTYSGGTVFYPGLITISANNVLGTGDAQLLPGAILEYKANISLRNRLLILGGKLRVATGLTLYCTNTVKGDLEVEAVGAATAGLGGLIEDYSASETGRLVKTGTGQLSLKSPNNTYSGGTLVRDGILVVSAIEKALGKGNVTVTNGAELQLYDLIETTWPGWEVEVLSNATVRLRSASSSVFTTNVVVRNGGNIKGHSVMASYFCYDRVRIEGRVFLHRYAGATGYNLWYGTFRDGAVPGRLVYTGTGTGVNEIKGANTYTGGTEIEDGGANAASLKLVTLGRMPDVGQILIHTNGVMDFNNIADTVGGLAGVGLVSLGKAVVTVNEGVSPGTNDLKTGLLTIATTSTLARITLAASSTNTFHLRMPGQQDQVVIQGAGGLTLAGSIKIAGAPTLASGTYTLFDLNGGSLLGTIPSLILPPLCTGSVATNSGDVVLTLNVPSKGTILMVR